MKLNQKINKIIVTFFLCTSFINLNKISYSNNISKLNEYKIALSDCKENFLSSSKLGNDILSIAHPTATYSSSSSSYYESSYQGYVISITYKSSFTGKYLNMKLLISYS